MGLSASSSYSSTGNAAAIVARVAAGATQGCQNWAAAVLADAQAVVPVRTGALRDSGHTETTEEAGGVAVQVVFDADYAIYVEFGTGRRGAASAGAGPGPYDPNWPGMAAQPYLRPAFDAHREDAAPTVAEAVREAI